MTTQNTQPGIDQLFTFWKDLPEEKRNTLDPENAEDLGKIMDLYMASFTEEEGSKDRKPREAKLYSILLLVRVSDQQADMHLIGEGFGSVGREPTDPRKWSDAKKIRSRAEVKALKFQSTGATCSVLQIESELLGNLFAPTVASEENENSTDGDTTA